MAAPAEDVAGLLTRVLTIQPGGKYEHRPTRRDPRQYNRTFSWDTFHPQITPIDADGEEEAGPAKGTKKESENLRESLKFADQVVVVIKELWRNCEDTIFNSRL
jgi:hypothetical protein